MFSKTYVLSLKSIIDFYYFHFYAYVYMNLKSDLRYRKTWLDFNSKFSMSMDFNLNINLKPRI